MDPWGIAIVIFLAVMTFYIAMQAKKIFAEKVKTKDQKLDQKITGGAAILLAMMTLGAAILILCKMWQG